MSSAVMGSRPVTEVLRAMARTPNAVYAAVAVPVVLAMVAVALQPWLLPSDLLRDSQAIAADRGDTHSAYGLVSNLGILAMALASGAALLGFAILRDTTGRMRPLLGCGALLSLAIVLDDLLLLHETLTFAAWARVLFAAAYAGAFACFLVRFRATIRQHLDVGLLLLAGVALGSSLLVDTVVEPATQLSVLVEDGAKLLGFVAWSAFVLRSAVFALTRRADAASGAPRARHGVRAAAAPRHPSSHLLSPGASPARRTTSPMLPSLRD